LEEEHVETRLCHCTGQRFACGVYICEGYRGSLFTQFLYRGSPNAGRSAGDDGDFPSEAICNCMPQSSDPSLGLELPAQPADGLIMKPNSGHEG
jgi:hypothetical protein